MSYLKTTLVLLLLLVFAFNGSMAEVPREIQRLQNLKTIIEGQEIPLDSRSYVLVIFKACCTPNEQAVDWMSKTHQLQTDSVTFVGLNVDRPRHLSKVKNWLFSRDVNFKVYSDPAGQMAAELKTLAPPSVIVFDGKGNELYRTLGFRPNDRKKLDDLLGLSTLKE